MTSRQAGQKISQIYRNQAGQRGGRRKTSEKPSGAQTRRLAQFLICGAVFVLLVAVKLLLPARAQWLAQHVGGALERSMDVTEAFSAVGRMFAGEDEGGWDDLYQSVFHPEETEAVPAAATVEDAETATQAEAVKLSATRKLLADRWGWLTEPPMTEPIQKEDMESEEPDAASQSPTQSTTAPELSDAAVPESTATQKLSYILYSNKTLPQQVSMEQRVLGFDYCTPVMGTISSDFGYREHPIEGEEKFHYGLDIAADEGTAVACFADGRVTAVGESSSYGKYAVVTHDNGFSTLYAHCSKITAASDTSVKEGQKIAEVGQTGEATGPHLHFELHAGDIYLDPVYYVSPA